MVLYNIFFLAGIIISFPLIFLGALVSEKRRATFLQRLGLKAPVLRRNKIHSAGSKCIWIHALSVGEVISAVPLINAFQKGYKDKKIVFSVSTMTGFQIADNLLKKNTAFLFFFPYDLIFSVKHIASRINPAFVIIVESDVWPNFLFEMQKRHIPVFLVNARLSNKSLAGYRRIEFFSKKLFMCFSKICAQSVEDGRRFKHLGIPSSRISITGNLKFDQAGMPLANEEIDTLRQSLRIINPRQKIFVAGSTHPGEESILLNAFSKLKNKFPDLLLIIVPRNPKRADSIRRIYQPAGFAVMAMKELDKLEPEKKLDVIVIDIIGILKKLYALADIAFVGGSLVKLGGHNPLEPAAYAKPILFGYDMSNFKQISQLLLKSGGAVQVKNATDIYNCVAKILKDNNKAIEIGEKAYNVFCSNKGAVEKTFKVITNSLTS